MTMPTDPDIAAAVQTPVWPDGQVVSKWADTDITVTRFSDHDSYAATLAETILARAANPSLSQHFDDPHGQDATKIYDVQKWATPASDLINARALAMFQRVLPGAAVMVDASWASVYSGGNFVLPHSHVGAIASVLYMLEPGDVSQGLDGQFLFVDPRLKPCCRQSAGFMTTPSAPRIAPGTMVMFPGQAVHMVSPYFGKTHRITMSWDLKISKNTPSAVPEFITRPS